MPVIYRTIISFSFLFSINVISREASDEYQEWMLVTNFEENKPLEKWALRDTRNDTVPYIENPQVTVIRDEKNNRYLVKKPAPDGIVGNRKALSYVKLPAPVAVGETYTFYTRINVESFPNNHVFGLTNLPPKGIDEHDYNAFEPTIRVTDKRETNGFKNNGTLMVRKGDQYEKIHPLDSAPASPMQVDTWYELWYVVNNASLSDGGQQYDLFIRGGEFRKQTKVFNQASFRMQREKPLLYFLANCNTGPQNQPYGNGGLRYDDIYMVRGVNLSLPYKPVKE